jgi:DNA polymerase-1
MGCESCKVRLGGTPKCKLGSLTKYVQIAGHNLMGTPRTSNLEAPTPHKIMIVCKSPDNRDMGTLGRGRNVEKLKELLDLATIDESDVFITGLVKCCPPKRPPSVQEVKACMGHLGDELKAVNPDVVILQGAATLRAFNLMGEGGVNSLHGKLLEKAFPHDDTNDKVYKIMVTTDPNALFMNPDPRLQGQMVKDLITAKAAVEGHLINPKQQPADYKLIDNMDDLEWMLDKIQKKGMFAFDSESRGLPWSKEPLICLQFCWGYDEDEQTVAVLPIYNHDPEGGDWKLKARWDETERFLIVNGLKEIFEDPSIPKVAHNIKYDMSVLRKHLGIETRGFLFDTILMHHVLWEHPPHDLEYLADLELNTGNYSKAVHDITGHGRVLRNTYDHVPDEILHPYGAKDAESTYRLFCRYYSRLKDLPEQWSLYTDEIHPFIRTMFKSEWYGTSLDSKVIDTLTTEFVNEQAALDVSLKARTWPEFNCDKSEDVARAIKEAGYWRDIETPKTTKGYSTDKSRLLPLAKKLPIVEEFMKYRSLTKLISTYMKNAKELSEGDGRARISVMLHGTVNGRPSCAFLHQIPRLDRKRIEQGLGNLRDMFIAREGYSMIYGDYSQIELVVLAIKSGDKNMMEIFRSGQDIHKATAAQFVGLEDHEVNEHNRDLAKPVNFSRVYGAVEGRALLKLTWMDLDGNEWPVTKEMIRSGYAALDARFPAAGEYFINTVSEISANAGVHTTAFGRVKHMGSTLNSGSKWARENAERQAVNGTIQSPAASVTIRTLNAMNEYLEEQIKAGVMTEEEAALIITVHDSGLFEVKNEHLGWFEPLLRETSKLPVPQLGNWEFTMKVGIGQSWSEAELNAR